MPRPYGLYGFYPSQPLLELPSLVGNARHQWPYTVLLSVSLVFALVYGIWRISTTLDFATIPNTLASVLLMSAELLGMFQFTVFGIFMYKEYRRPIPEWPPTKPLPSVDIFITTYNESPHILQKSLAACHNITYSRGLFTVYVCDDGNRPAIQELAQKWHAQYLARPTHEHAKAGNLNYALKHSTGDLIVTLDADMIPKPDIIHLMIGFFTDSKMGFVQAPQVFYNPDPFQHNLPFGTLRNNDQDYFMREMLPRRDRKQAVMYIGSNAMFSRKALEHIGGFITGSITEDLATGLVLQAEKFNTAYCDAVVATGLSPESFAEMVKQRERWCRGNLQVFRQHNILTPSGLTLWQRLAYISGTLYWYFGVQKLIFVLTPILFLFFGIIALHALVTTVAFMWIPYFLSQILTFKRLSKRKSNVWWSHVQELSFMPFLSLAALAETFNISMRGFRVTNKGVVTQKAHITKYFGILSGFTLLTLVALLNGIRLWSTYRTGQVHNSLEISMAWDTFNMLGLVFATIGAYERPRPRVNERRPVEETAYLVMDDNLKYHVELYDISESGVRISNPPQNPCRVFQHAQLIIRNHPYPITITKSRHYRDQNAPEWIGQFRSLAAIDYGNLIHLIYGAAEPRDCPNLNRVTDNHFLKPAKSTVMQPSNGTATITPGDVG